MISSSSSFASSMPATSSKVTLCWFSVSSFARLLPNDIALPPPTCIWRMKKIQTPISSSIGAHCTSATTYQGSRVLRPRLDLDALLAQHANQVGILAARRS